MDYKERKELFVKGLEGSSLLKVVGVLYATVLLHGVWKLSHTWLVRRRWLREGPYRGVGCREFWFEFVVLVVPLLVLLTGGADQLVTVNGVGTVVVLVGYLLWARSKGKHRTPAVPPVSTTTTKKKQLLSTLVPYISVFRSVLMLLTIISILAVDFHVFPRYYGKVENFGSSLMDLGVGFFVFSSGLVSGRRSTTPAGSDSSPRQLGKALYHAIPLWGLGLARLVAVKQVNYQEHASEYGIHWNFFLTLGTLPLTVTSLEFSQLPLYLLGWVPGLLYQVILHRTTLQDYILYSPRIPGDLLSLNREGLYSMWGYTAIFLLGKDLGSVLLNPSQQPILYRIMKRLITAVTIFGILHYLLDIPISRRLANAPYVAWVAWMSQLMILGYWLTHALFRLTTPPQLYQAINYNGLALFLLSNLLTGLVNLTVPTLDLHPPATYFLLLGYLLIVTTVAHLLHDRGWRLIRF